MASRALQLKNYVMRALLNPLRSKNRIEPLGRWNIVVGDTVQLNTGRDKGKSGKVKKVLRSRNRLVVEGLNLKRKHMRPVEGRAGGVISIEAPLHYSNVNLVDAASGCAYQKIINYPVPPCTAPRRPPPLLQEAHTRCK